MFIGSLGAALTLGRGLVSVLDQLTSSPATTSADSVSGGSFAATAAAPAAAAAPSNALTGGGKPSLSGDVLALLIKLQQQAANGSTAANASTGISTTTAKDPLANLISAMDSDGDGTISPTEMEAYVQKQGGTASQADSLFAALNQGSSGNLTKTQLAGDLQQAGGAHHHHHHLGAASATQVGQDLVGAMDTNADGTVNQSEFETFVTGHGGTKNQADADFSALDPTNTGSVGASQFASAVAALQAANGSGQSPVLNLLDAFRQTAAASTSSISVTA